MREFLKSADDLEKLALEYASQNSVSLKELAYILDFVKNEIGGRVQLEESLIIAQERCDTAIPKRYNGWSA